MDLWNKVSGYLRAELTVAEPERFMDQLAKMEIQLWDVQRRSALCIEFCVDRKYWSAIKNVAGKLGGTLRLRKTEGLLYSLNRWRKRPVLIGFLAVLILASVYLPGRIFFLEITGNQYVPAALIQEKARELGLDFGVSRRQLRSEKIKNELLASIEQLEWVGVNTSGCVATISVREKQEKESVDEHYVCNLVSSADGIVESVSLKSGTLHCKPGQAVQRGQLLVSGYKDLGICTRAVEADAEIYALTRRETAAVLPASAIMRGDESDNQTKYSILIGKKRINLYSNSGILMPTCGKMTKVIPLCLPGDFVLPISLVVEEYTVYQEQTHTRQEQEASAILIDAASRYLEDEMIAGQILAVDTQLSRKDGQFVLSGSFECREMIGRQTEAVYLEDDTEDGGENGERRTG